MSISKNFRFIFLTIILAELLSFLGYYFPIVNFIAFFVIAILVIILSLYKLAYGIWLLLAELFIGSFGYLFYFENHGLKISIRLALWLIVLSVWLAKTILAWVKNKKLSVDFLRSNYFNYFFILFTFIAWGLASGVLNKNSAINIFQDFDRWLYFLLIFPIFSILHNQENFKTLNQVLLACITWLSLKTLILFYIFSHNFNGLILDVYNWVRLSGVGEITQVQGGFNRVFMQSQIFILIGLFFILFKLVIPGLTRDPEDLVSKKNLDSGSPYRGTGQATAGMTKYILLLSLFLSTILISFSRSFWIGLAAGGIFVWLIILFKLKIKFKQFIIFNSLAALSALFSIILALAIVFFPFPAPLGGFNPADLLGDRATQIGEAGASSRWQLLQPLWQKIKQAPILGQGFGATVTYKTNDPRILASNPTGIYTTYAFEWGWLDVWLKLGLFGLLAYLVLFIKIIFDGIKTNSYFSLSLAAGLLVLMAINIFSPYVNHPLGIGYLMIAAAALPLREI